MKLFTTVCLGLFVSFNIFAQEEFKFGSVAQDVPAEMVKRLTPIVEYLSKKTGYRVSLQVSSNMQAAIESLGTGTTQISYLTPVAYIEAREKYGAVPVASFLQDGQGYFKLVVVVKNDSTIKTVQDLKGKKFAFGDIKAKLQQAIVIKSGIKLESFASYDFLNHYDNIAKAVLNGDFDAGILTEAVAKKFKKDGIRIIHTSVKLPAHLIVANRKVAPETISKFRNALLALKVTNPKDKAIIVVFDPMYDGFKKANDKDYDAVRLLTRVLK